MIERQRGTFFRFKNDLQMQAIRLAGRQWNDFNNSLQTQTIGLTHKPLGCPASATSIWDYYYVPDVIPLLSISSTGNNGKKSYDDMNGLMYKRI